MADPGGSCWLKPLLDQPAQARWDQAAWRSTRQISATMAMAIDQAIGAQERHQPAQGRERTGFGPACGHILQLFCEFLAGLRHVCPWFILPYYIGAVKRG